MTAYRSDHKFGYPSPCACRDDGPMNVVMTDGAAIPSALSADRPGSAAIEVANLVKVYKTTRAVDDVSFRIARGSITGLLGGNGAGKTTTIAMIMGLVLPTSGRIQVLGFPMPEQSGEVLGRMNFESPYVDMPMRLTVRQNLTIFGRLYAVPDLSQRIEKLAADLDLGDFLDRANGKPARDFAGTLPFPWPADARSPVTAPLFPAGYGLTYAHAQSVGPVNEDPRVDLSAAASDNLWFNRGVAPSPWHLGLDNAVTARSVDLAAQEDARQFTWAAPGALAIDGPPVDLTRQADEGFEVRLDWRIDALPAGLIKVSVGTGSLDVASLLRLAPQGAVTQTRIPLRCFADAGANLKQVGTPLRITAPQGFVVTLSNARVEATGSVVPCPPKG